MAGAASSSATRSPVRALSPRREAFGRSDFAVSSDADCDRGASSSTFEVSPEFGTLDGRRFGPGMAEVRQVMCQEGISFDEARLQLVWRTMLQNGVDSSGMPTDPKTFTFEQATGALPKPWAAGGGLAREASNGREGSVARAIRPIKACQKKAREKANSLLGLPMTKLSDSNLDVSGLADDKGDGKGCHCKGWLRGLAEVSKAGKRVWKTNKWYLLRGFLLLVLGLVVIVLRLDMDRPSALPRLMGQEPDAALRGHAGAGT